MPYVSPQVPQTALKFLFILTFLVGLNGCGVQKIVTVPVKVAYTTTKYAVKGTTAVVKAVIPDSHDKNKDQDK